MEVDTRKDIQFYSHIIDKLGPKGDSVAEEIFAADLSWIGWEICRSERPKSFFYKILEVGGEARLVHQRDLVMEEDILTKINPYTRNGLEFLQMSKVRLRLLSAENGAIATWVSPKKMQAEDPKYPLDQINIAKKIDEETIWVKQTQGDFTPPNTNLVDLMLNIGKEDIGSWEVLEDRDLTKGKQYVLAIKQGLSADSLRLKRAELLKEAIPYTYFGSKGSILTSCGAIDFGGSGWLGGSYNYGLSEAASWFSYNAMTGEYRCKFCTHCVYYTLIKNHRCVC